MQITCKNLRRFICMLNYYQASVLKLFKITLPLKGISVGPKNTNQTILKPDDIQVKTF